MGPHDYTPPEPTSRQCGDRARIDLPDGTRAHACWFPAMGGYAGKAVVTVGDCKQLWVWHDGRFPFTGQVTSPPGAPVTPDTQYTKSPRPATLVHLEDQWIDFFQQLKTWHDDEFNMDRTPDLSNLVHTTSADPAPDQLEEPTLHQLLGELREQPTIRWAELAIPRTIKLPPGVSTQEAKAAIELCNKLGLVVPDLSVNGYILMSAGPDL
jgi:hypothetical protein